MTRKVYHQRKMAISKIVFKPANSNSSPPPSGGSGGSTPPPPSGDTRSESYLKLAAARSSGSTGNVAINPDNIVTGISGQVAISGGVGNIQFTPTPIPSSVVPVSAGVALVGKGVDPSKVSYDPQRVVLAEARGDPVSRRVAFESAPRRESVDRNILNQQRPNQPQNDNRLVSNGQSIRSDNANSVDILASTQRSQETQSPSQTRTVEQDILGIAKKAAVPFSIPVGIAGKIAKSSEGQAATRGYADTLFVEPAKGTFKIINTARPTLINPVSFRYLLPVPDPSLGRAKAFAPLAEDSDVQAAGLAIGTYGVAKLVPGSLKYIQTVFFVPSSVNFVSAVQTGDIYESARASTGILFTAGGPLQLSKQALVPIGARYVPSESVFAKSVLTGKERLPLTKSVSESVSRFEAVKSSDGEGILVQTSSDQPGFKANTAGVGKKASAGLEDPGIYVTPAGEGSPYFLRTGGVVEPTYEFSLNPFKGALSQPTVTQFKATGVVQLPRSVIGQPGFGAVAEFQKTELAGTGKVQITKRSELGQGNIPVDVSIPGKAKFGTDEIEAVVPVTQTFRYTPKTFFGRLKGYEQYTKFDGELVPIRQAELVVTKGGRTTPLQGGRIITSRKILSESRSLSELSSTRRVSPIIAPRLSYATSSSRGSSLISTPESSITSSPARSSVISSPSKSSIVSPPSKGSSILGSSSSKPTSRVTTGGSSVLGGSKASSVLGSSNKSSSVAGSSQSSPVIGRGDFGRLRREGGLKFDVEVRRYGKFKTVEGGLTLSEAKQSLIGTLRGGLGATGRIRVSGGGQTVRLAAPSGFYTKGDAIIQRRGFRLDTSGEVREIGIARKKKKSSVGGF